MDSVSPIIVVWCTWCGIEAPPLFGHYSSLPLDFLIEANYHKQSTANISMKGVYKIGEEQNSKCLQLAITQTSKKELGNIYILIVLSKWLSLKTERTLRKNIDVTTNSQGSINLNICTFSVLIWCFWGNNIGLEFYVKWIFGDAVLSAPYL